MVKSFIRGLKPLDVLELGRIKYFLNTIKSGQRVLLLSLKESAKLKEFEWISKSKSEYKFRINYDDSIESDIRSEVIVMSMFKYLGSEVTIKEIFPSTLIFSINEDGGCFNFPIHLISKIL